MVINVGFAVFAALEMNYEMVHDVAGAA